MAQPTQAKVNALAQSLAVGAASIAVAYALIPDKVIYTNKELTDRVQLTESEILKRKLFIAYVMYQGLYRIPKNIMAMSNTLASQDARKHCLLAAQLLSASPGIALTVRAAMKIHSGEELTAKKEDYISPEANKYIVGSSILGSLSAGTIRAMNAIDAGRYNK